MNKKKKNEIIGTFIKVIPLLFIVYATSSGAYINGGEYTDSQINLYGLIDFLTITIVCMIVPFIWRIANKQKFTCDKGKKICRWNSIILFIISVITLGAFGIHYVTWINAIIYYFVNKWIFVDETKTDIKEKRKEKKSNNKNNKWEINLCTKCYAKVKETDEICPKCGNVFNDTNQIYENNEVVITENIVNDSVKVQGKTRYCKLCGGKLNNDKKCTKCGKQYFRITRELILYIVMGILFVLLGFFVTLCVNNYNEVSEWKLQYQTFENKYKGLKNQQDELTKGKSYQETKNKLDFFNEDIVFVIEGHGNVYYTYDCTPGILVVKYEDYLIDFYHPLTDAEVSYNVYRKEDAIRKGYKEGTC